MILDEKVVDLCKIFKTALLYDCEKELETVITQIYALKLSSKCS